MRFRPPKASVWNISAQLSLSGGRPHSGFRELAGPNTGGSPLHHCYHPGPPVQAYVEQQPWLAQTSSHRGDKQTFCSLQTCRSQQGPKVSIPDTSYPISITSLHAFTAMQAFLFHQTETHNAGQEPGARAGHLPMWGTHRWGGFALLAA